MLNKSIRIACKGSGVLALDDLVELQGNLKILKKQDYLRLRKSILDFGFSFPAQIWKAPDGKAWILDAHQRYRTLKNMRDNEGFEIPPIPVCEVEAKDLQEAKKKCLAAASQYGQMEPDGLYEFMAEADLALPEVEASFRFPEIDMGTFAMEYFKESGGQGEDEIPEAPKKPITKTGDLWIMGEHRLLCGDSTKAEDLRRLMGGEKATVMFSDPPYGVSIGKKQRALNAVQKAGRNLDDLEGDDMNEGDLKALLLGAYSLARKEALADDCSVFTCAPQGGSLGMMMMMMMMQAAGLPTRHVLIWQKNCPTFSIGRLDYDYKHEPILFTWVKTHKRIKAGPWQNSLWTCDKPTANKEHPTMKPVALYENAYLNHSESGDLVLDIFGGSGTALVAAQKHGRRARVMEIEPRYVDVSVARWELFSEKKAVLERGMVGSSRA